MIGSRSAWTAAVALGMLASPVAASLLLRPDRALEASTPSASGPAWIATHRPRSHRPAQPSLDPSQLAAARSVARRFALQYATYVGGRTTARMIADAAPGLIRELHRHPPRITPTHQQRQPSLRRLNAEPDPGTVRAVATLQDAGGPPYRLAFYLERRGRRWLVTRLLDA
jgi:hypothetical protein